MAITRRRARTSTAWVLATAGTVLLAACAAPAGDPGASGASGLASAPDPTPSVTATPTPVPTSTSTSTSTSTLTPQPTATATASAAWMIGPNGECDAAQLEYALESRPMDSGMSQFYWNLQMTNTSSTACILEGYPQVQLVSSRAGERISASSGRDTPQTEGVVDMPPGASAYSLLHLSQAGAYGCALVPVAELAVTLPYGNVSRNVTTPNEIDGCDDATTELVSAGPLTAAPAPG